MTKREKGFSLIELLIVVAILLILAALAIPNLFKSRQRANDAAAVSALRVLVVSETSYSTTYGQAVGFAPNLATLGQAPTCDQTHACLIDAQLGCASEPCIRGGYNYFSDTSASGPPIATFSFTATPVGWQGTGTSNFCVTDDGVIRFQVGGTGSLSAAVQHDKCLNFALYQNI